MKGKRLLIILFVLNVFLIWGNSALPGPTSHKVSNAVVDTLGEVANIDTVEYDEVGDEVPVSDRTIVKIVRKSAHILEYLALGILSCMLFFYTRIGAGEIKNLILCGVCVPIIDETIQIFSNRTHSISDIWIDIAGFAAGCIIVIGVKFITKKLSVGKHN